MKNKDQILLEQAYLKILEENVHFVYDNIPNNIGYSNKTFNVRGKDVLVRIVWDRDEDSEWYYLNLVDPLTKEAIFKDIDEDEIEQLLKSKI